MNSMKRRTVLCGLVGLAGLMVLGRLTAQAQHRVLRIAAASDLQPVMPAFAQAYEKKTGIKLEVSFGSSSALTTQIVNGAPFDVFLAADFSFPMQVVAAGLADEKQPRAYANGTLVLWARKDSPIKPLTIEQLTNPQVTRIAVADSIHAPYGRATVAALRQMQLLEKIKGKLVTAENVSQTAQFVETGNAQMGFISLTLAESPRLKETGTFVRVPEVYPKIRQCAVVMKKSDRLEDARAFLRWMMSSEVQEHLKDFGLQPPY